MDVRVKWVILGKAIRALFHFVMDDDNDAGRVFPKKKPTNWSGQAKRRATKIHPKSLPVGHVLRTYTQYSTSLQPTGSS